MSHPDAAPRWREDRWFPWFLLSIACVAGAVAALAWVAFDAASGEDTPDIQDPVHVPTQTTASPTTERLLRVWVDPATGFTLPGDLNIEVVATREQADVAVEEGDGEAFAARLFVPVTALFAGVDSLSTDELRGLLSGSIGSWGAVGGVEASIAGAVVPAVVTGDEARLAEMLGVGFGAEARRFGTYEELLAAMTEDSGMVAMVPSEMVRVQYVPVAIDGLDPVRGEGELADWPYQYRLGVTGLTGAGDRHTAVLAEALQFERPVVTTVIATGDILINRCSLARVEATGDWGAALRGPVGDYLASGDLTIGQYDGSIQDLADVYRCSQHTNLSSPPGVIENLTLAGFDGMSLATNHIADCGMLDGCGMRTLIRTIELLEEAGITTYGAGRNLEEALAPGIFERNRITFGVLGFDDVAASFLEAGPDSAGTAPLDDSYADEIAEGYYYIPFFAPASMLQLERFTRLIRELKEQVDVVIVQVETGTEDTHDPSVRSIKALRAAAEAGADIIIGNQAHHVQGVEIWEGTLIPYALGNFIYDQVHTPEHTQGYILQTTLWGTQVMAIKMVPYQIENLYRPVFVEGTLRAKILGDVFGATIRPE